MKITTNAISARQHSRFIQIYKKEKITKRVYIKKADTLQKARQFPLRFYIQKAIHFTSRNFL